MNFLFFVSLSVLLNFCKAGKFEGSVVVTPPPAPIYHSTDTYPELPAPTNAPLPTTSTSSDPMKGIAPTVAPPPPAAPAAPVVTPPPTPAPTPAPANQDNNGWIPYAVAGAATIGAIALLSSNNNDSSKPPPGFILGDLEKSNCKKEYLRYPNTIQNYAYGICQGTLGSEKSPNMGTCIDQCVAAAKS